MNKVYKYTTAFSVEKQAFIREVSPVILRLAPYTEENISYGMPAYGLKGLPLVYFAAYIKHIGFYETASGHTKFASKFSVYKQGKGAVQFPLNKPLPLGLIKKIVQFRILENTEIATPKNKK